MKALVAENKLKPQAKQAVFASGQLEAIGKPWCFLAFCFKLCSRVLWPGEEGLESSGPK